MTLAVWSPSSRQKGYNKAYEAGRGLNLQKASVGTEKTNIPSSQEVGENTPCAELAKLEVLLTLLQSP